MEQIVVIKSMMTVMTLIAVMYGFVKFIDSRISKKIEGVEFIKKVSEHLRPYVIFNERNEIIVDRGGMNFINEIEIILEEKLPCKIILKLKKHNSTAPILLMLDNDICTIEEKRGKNFEWVYKIDYSGLIERDERRFSVEIVT